MSSIMRWRRGLTIGQVVDVVTAVLLSEVTGISISGSGAQAVIFCLSAGYPIVTSVPVHQVSARLSGLSRSDFVLWP
jgi:hypothetical protein